MRKAPNGDLRQECEVAVAAEIAELTDRQHAYDQDAARLQREQYAAEDKGDEKQAQKLNQQMHRALNAATSIGEKIAALRSPAEVSRRVQERLDRQNTKQRLNALQNERSTGTMEKATTPKTKKVTAQDLGVPAVYLGDKGSFKPGADAALKSDLILAILEQPARKGAPASFTKTEAESLFAKFPQWSGFLTRKQEILAEKAAKAEERKAAAKQRVASKKNGSATDEVKSDPKPVAKKRTRKQVAAK